MEKKTICRCSGITNLDIKDAIDKGNKTFEEVEKTIGMESSCNTCKGAAEKEFKDMTKK